MAGIALDPDKTRGMATGYQWLVSKEKPAFSVDDSLTGYPVPSVLIKTL